MPPGSTRKYCNALAGAVQTAEADSPIPDTAMQKMYAASLNAFKQGAADCAAGITQHAEGGGGHRNEGESRLRQPREPGIPQRGYMENHIRPDLADKRLDQRLSGVGWLVSPLRSRRSYARRVRGA